MTKAYSYLRFSNPKQIKEEKLERQMVQARLYALNHDLDLDEFLTFRDLGVSAYYGANKKTGNLGDFLEAVRQGFVEKGSVLLIESLDRLSRETARKALRTLEDICDEGIKVVTLIDQQEYTAERLDKDPTALIISIVIFIRANEESEVKSKRVRAAWANKIERARKGENVVITPVFPSWIKRKGKRFVIDEEKAKPVREIFKMAEMGIGASAIASALNLRNVPSLKTGVTWNKNYVMVLLKSKSVIGTHQPYTNIYKDGVKKRFPLDPVENYYPPIVKENVWRKVQGFIGERFKKFPKKMPSPQTVVNVFARISKCPRCGFAMTRRYKKYLAGKKDYSDYHFVCSKSESNQGCKFVMVPYAPVEALFLDEAEKFLKVHLAEIKNLSKAEKKKFEPNELKLLGVRVNQVLDILAEDKVDKTALNGKLRRLFKRVVVEYENETLRFEFKYGGIAYMSYKKAMKEHFKD